MKKFYLPVLLLFSMIFLASNAMAVNRTWTGAVNNVFNNVGNWTGGGALNPVDNFTVNLTSTTTITLNANITINNLTFTGNSPGGSGIVLSRLDVLGFVLTVNGTATFNPVRYQSGTQRDEVQVDAGSATGGYVFNGAVTFQTTGAGDTFIEADAAAQGSMTFRNTCTLGAWAYTVPFREPDFIFDAPVSQTLNYNSNNFVIPASLVFGSTNAPVVTITGTGAFTMFAPYDGTFTVNTGATADINDWDMDAYNGASLTLNAGGTLLIGGNSDFPGSYSSRTLSTTSTVFYDGPSAQNITSLTYGSLGTGGAGNKTQLSSFSMHGDFINNGTFFRGANTREITFIGTPNQAISGSNSPYFGRIRVNKPSGTLTLNVNISINNRLLLTAGPMDLGGFRCYIVSTATGAVQRVAGYVIAERSDFSSTFRWRINNTNGNHVIPFGNAAGAYIPLTIARVAGNQGTFTVSTYPTAASNLPYPPGVTDVDGNGSDNSANTINRFWEITTTSGGPNSTVTFTYADSDIPPAGEAGLQGQRWGSYWEPALPGQTSLPASNQVIVPGITAFSPWTLARSLSPLPVDLLSCEIECDNNIPVIQWQTGSEINCDRFEIERSADGIMYETIGSVKGAGNSQTVLDYSFADPNPLSETAYYRLKQIDYNSAYKYYNVMASNCGGSNENVLQVYNNQTNDIYLGMQAFDSEQFAIHIFDLSGKLIATDSWNVQEGTNTKILDADDLSTGIYIVRVSNQYRQYSEKLIRQ